MSRVGKKPITIPQGVNVKISGRHCSVKGPKGALNYDIPEAISVSIDDNKVILARCAEDRFSRALHGLARALIANMVTGVSQGFRKSLVVDGIGYRVQIKGDVLSLTIGFNNPVEHKLPDGIKASVEKNVITLEGVDKQLLGQTAAIIRSYRRAEPYKGKGIRYDNEVIRRKAGKVGTK